MDGAPPVHFTAHACAISEHPQNFMVGAARFELATTRAQGECATRLRYAPNSSTVLQLLNAVLDTLTELSRLLNSLFIRA